MSISLYVETDGESDTAEGAIAEAAIDPTNIPFEEGDVIEVQIDATWTTPDGKHHAKVSLVKQSKPKLTDGDKEVSKKLDSPEEDIDDENEKEISGNREYEPDIDVDIDNQSSSDNDIIENSEEALAAVAATEQINYNLTERNSSPVEPEIVVAHDGLTDNDPANLESSALELTPDMAAAEKELENDFTESRNPNSQRSKDLVDKPAPEEGYDSEEYYSEGLRRDNEPNLSKKNKPEETPV